MTREQAGALALILQAYAEGKELQWKLKSETEWKDYDEGRVSFGTYLTDWRIKPTPQTWWACTNCGVIKPTEFSLRRNCPCPAEFIHHVTDVSKEGAQ